jgi:hypothetical protein
VWTAAQDLPSVDPAQWGPLGLSASLVFWFCLALAKRWIRWGSDFSDLERRLERAEQRVTEAEARERALIERKDDEIARIRDRIEEKLSRANEALAGATEALKNRR